MKDEEMREGNKYEWGWVGVDLDRTLAVYEHGLYTPYEIGEPIPLMLARVKSWIALGRDVRIFTARVHPDRNDCYSVPNIRRNIEDWCLKHVGKVLPITCSKDWSMVELWDDRAIQVEPNTGKRADGKL